MSINATKSCCLRIDSRFDRNCCSINILAGLSLPWVSELKYLGIYLVSSRTFRCYLDQTKRAYYRSLNAICGKIGRIASEEVVFQLFANSEACCLRQSDIRSLDFAVNRLLMKLFRTTNMMVIQDCARYFNFKLPSSILVNGTIKFLEKYHCCENLFCKLFVNIWLISVHVASTYLSVIVALNCL